MPTRWRIPADRAALTTIPAHGFLTIWADKDTSEAGLHASFSLNAGGETLALADADGVTVLDSVSFGEQRADISYGRFPDGDRHLAGHGHPHSEGADEFENIDPRTSQNYAWSLDSFNDGKKNTFVREEFCRDLQRETGQPYTRTRYYHLYLNGQYRGLYETQERSEASYAATYFGGEPDDYDVIKTGDGGVFFTDGSTDEWNLLWDLCQQGFNTDERYYAVQGKRADGTDDPNIPVRVDLVNLIDYMLGIFFTGNDDAPIGLGGGGPNNFVVVRNRRIEVARKNFTGQPTWNSVASAQNPDSDAVNFEEFNITAQLATLRRGGNILAIQAMNNTTTSSELLLGVELAASKAPAGSVPSGVAPTAARYAQPFALTQSARVKARALAGTEWSALNEAVFAVGPVADSLRVSEIMYHPQDTGNPNDPNTEFIELTNIGDEAINLNLVRFTKGIDFAFASTELAPAQYVLVVKDREAMDPNDYSKSAAWRASTSLGGSPGRAD